MADLTLKRHDTYPPLRATLSDVNGPIDLTSAVSVKLIMKGKTSLVTGLCAIVSPSTSGSIQYNWATNDLSVSDTYNVEFEIGWAGGGIQTVPNSGYSTIEVVDDLENA